MLGLCLLSSTEGVVLKRHKVGHCGSLLLGMALALSLCGESSAQGGLPPIGTSSLCASDLDLVEATLASPVFARGVQLLLQSGPVLSWFEVTNSPYGRELTIFLSPATTSGTTWSLVISCHRQRGRQPTVRRAVVAPIVLATGSQMDGVEVHPLLVLRRVQASLASPISSCCFLWFVR